MESPHVLKIPVNRPKVIEILDTILDGSTLHIPDVKLSRILGMYVRPWHKKGFIGIYQDPLLKDTVVKFNVPKVEKKISWGGKRIDYIINVNDSFLKTNIKI